MMDIITIDKKIRENFNSEQEKLLLYKGKLSKLKNMKGLNPRTRAATEKTIVDLEKYVNDLEEKKSYNFYIFNTIELILEFQKILKSPMKLNFTGKPIENNKEKNEIIQKYVKIAIKYIDIDIQSDKKTDPDEVVCDNCGNKKEFDIIDGNIYICDICSVQKNVNKQTTSYGDIDRVNISPKYIYDRKIHFRDCINQYQGKQNSTIPQKVYDDLIYQFDNHHMLVNSTDKKTKFSKVSKNLIRIFLKDLNYTNHYENIHLIHYNLTGIQPDNISYLEDQLLDDFDILTDLYDKRYKNIERKNFINTQHILYQFLIRHKHKCNREDFAVLKTMDRRAFHDEVCKKLFEELGWNYTPFF